MTPADEQLDKVGALAEDAIAQRDQLFPQKIYIYPKPHLISVDCQFVADCIAEIRRLRKILHRIGHHPHSTYSDDCDEYQMGVADGHRCAAKLALGEEEMEEME